MERTLAVFLADEPAPFRPVLAVFQRLVAALNAIHAAHLSHQPLTPDAVRLNEADQLTIQTTYSRPNGSDTVVFSKTKYAAPDAFISTDDNPSPCESIDCYVTGFIFYEILIGTRLFREQFAALEDGPPSLWLKWHLDQSTKARPLKELRPELGRFAEVIDGMLDKDPAKRTQSLTGVASLFSNLGEETNEKNKVPRSAPQAASTRVPPRSQFDETVIRPKPESTSPAKQPPQPEPAAAPAASRNSSALSMFGVFGLLANPWLIIGVVVSLTLALLFSDYFSRSSQKTKPLPPMNASPFRAAPSRNKGLP